MQLFRRDPELFPLFALMRSVMYFQSVGETGSSAGVLEKCRRDQIIEWSDSLILKLSTCQTSSTEVLRSSSLLIYEPLYVLRE